jgi:hypothetical protein
MRSITDSLIDLPAAADRVSAGPGGVGQQRHEAHHPPVDSGVVDLDPALGQELFDVAVGEAEAQIPAHREDDDVGREAEPREGGVDDGHGAKAAGSHRDSLPAQRRSQQLQQSPRTSIE